MKIYLAGGMQDGWQDAVAVAQLAIGKPIELLDPRTINAGIDDPRIYTEHDLAAIRGADAVLAYMDSANPSGFGMSVEVGYAYGIGKPVAFVDCIGGDWRSRYFGMHRTMANATFADVASALAHIVKHWA